MGDLYGELFDEFQQNLVEDNGIVLSIDTMRGMYQSEVPMVGLSWSNKVFDYMAEDMDAARIEKFFQDSIKAGSDKYYKDVIKRSFNENTWR